MRATTDAGSATQRPSTTRTSVNRTCQPAPSAIATTAGEMDRCSQWAIPRALVVTATWNDIVPRELDRLLSRRV
jgi:hypothetical protein